MTESFLFRYLNLNFLAFGFFLISVPLLYHLPTHFLVSYSSGLERYYVYFYEALIVVYVIFPCSITSLDVLCFALHK